MKIILPTVHRCLIAMVCQNLRQANLPEVGLTKIPTVHGALSIVCHVELHVDFSSTNFSFEVLKSLKLTKHRKYCKKNNQLSTKSLDELKGNSIVSGLIEHVYLENEGCN